MHETVPRRHKQVLHEDGALVPVDDLRRDAIGAEWPDEATVPNGGRSLDHRTALADNHSVETAAFVEVGARKVDFTQVSSIVHVEEQRVQVGGETDTWADRYINKI